MTGHSLLQWIDIKDEKTKSAAQAISEIMSNWSMAETEAKIQFPNATDEEIYQSVKSVMNLPPGLQVKSFFRNSHACHRAG
jgi:hypothetical protein